MSKCYAWRGPTTCEGFWHKCICKPGYCAVDGACKLSIDYMKADVASITSSSPAFPSPQNEISTAVCISGGGSRSLSLAMGQLRALENIGLMRKVDAISAVSGGSWATSVYMFANMPTEELLGKATSPSSLTMEALRKAPAKLGETVTKSSSLAKATELLAEGTPLHRIWQLTVAKIILSPFGLDSTSFMAADADAVNRIVGNNPDMKKYDFMTPIPGRPKAFIMGGTLLAPEGQHLGNNAVSFQMSPDYTGSPFHPDGGPLNYGSGDLIVGGGMVETFAFGGMQPAMQSGGTQSLPAPGLPFTLTDAVGISSAAFASKMSKWSPVELSKVDPRVEYWPVTQEKQDGMMFELGDGGNLENSGLLQVLQRGAKKIVQFANTNVDLVAPSSFDFCSLAAGAQIPEIENKVSKQIYDKFGYGTGVYAHDQVFSASDLAPILCDLQKLREDGKPAVVRKSLQVVPNTWWGIAGGHSVDLVLIYNAVCKDFENSLPSDTQAELRKGSWGDFANYPYYKTVGQNWGLDPLRYSAQQVNLLAAQAEYIVTQSQDILKSVLA